MLGTMPLRRHHRLHAFVLAVSLTAAGCAPIVDARGNLPPAERLAQIKPGAQTRDQVAQILGSPSTLSAFGDPTWYYVSYRTETTAFFAPAEVERKVIAVEFDPRGYVRKVDSYGMEDGKDVQFVKRETPTAGKEMSVLQQFLGNVGRFEGSEKDTSSWGHNIPK